MSEGQLLPALVCAVLLTLALTVGGARRRASTRAQPRRAAPTRRTASRRTASRGGASRRTASRGGASRRTASRGGAAAAGRSPDAATLLDLTAAMLRAGVGIEAAVARLAEDVPGCAELARVYRGLCAGQRWRQAWSCVGSQRQLREFGEQLAFAHATGAPTVELLELTALQSRRRRRQAVEEKAARLAVQMVLPLGLCFLPGFILLGVIPVVLGLVQELA